MQATLEPSRSGDESSSHGTSSHGTSRSLIERVRGDELGAWDRLVTLYAPLVAYWCRTRRLGHADTADVFQEVFQAVALHIGDFRREQKLDTFRGWLRTITLNKVNDHFRKLQREPQGIGGSEAQQRLTSLPAPSERSEESSAATPPGNEIPIDSPAEIERTFERNLFRRGLDLIRSEFEPRTWQAFWMTAVDGRATADVAADLAMTSGAVRVAKSRVLHRLRTELGDLRK
ncbi:MAG: sigma-70 family RNA polymerase sigma factor [Planctomycetia bacterium]|nr:sigma-70 family RNA polymerase sigma factor [Planctomycetia bacterium]